MEEIKNLNVNEQVTDVVEVATEKLTFKENVIAYGLAGIFATGLVTIGYLGYKGTKKLVNKIGDKKKLDLEAEDNEDDIVVKFEKHEDNEDDSE